MFDITKLRAIMALYPHIHPEDTYELDRYWKDLSGALLEDIDGTIQYLQTAASAEELERISEVTDELVERTQSIPLIETIRTAYCRHSQTRNDHLLFENLDLSIAMLHDKDAARRLLQWQPPKH